MWTRFWLALAERAIKTAAPTTQSGTPATTSSAARTGGTTTRSRVLQVLRNGTDPQRNAYRRDVSIVRVLAPAEALVFT